MLVRRITFCLLVTGLVSCSYVPRTAQFQDRDTHYLTAKSIPPMRTPPGVSSNAVHNYYPVSQQSYSESSKKLDLTPPGL